MGIVTQHHVAQRCPWLAPAVFPTLQGELKVTTTLGAECPCQSGSTDGSRTEARRMGRRGAPIAQLHRLEPTAHRYAIPIQAAADEIDSQLAGLPFEDRARDLVARVRALPTTSQATIHGEPAASNLQRLRDGRVCLLDWDQSGCGPTVLDLGFPLINAFLSYDLRWNSAAARAFYDGYRALPTSPRCLAPTSSRLDCSTPCGSCSSTIKLSVGSGLSMRSTMRQSCWMPSTCQGPRSANARRSSA